MSPGGIVRNRRNVALVSVDFNVQPFQARERHLDMWNPSADASALNVSANGILASQACFNDFRGYSDSSAVG
jgi:hypothetical protein